MDRYEYEQLRRGDSGPPRFESPGARLAYRSPPRRRSGSMRRPRSLTPERPRREPSRSPDRPTTTEKDRAELAKSQQDLIDHLSAQKNKMAKELDNANARIKCMLKFSVSWDGFPCGAYILGRRTDLQELIFTFETKRKKMKRKAKRPEVTQLIQVPAEVLMGSQIGGKILAYARDNFLIRERFLEKYGDPCVSKAIVVAIELGFYDFEKLKDKGVFVVLAVRDVEGGLEIGYFGGKLGDSTKSTHDVAFRALKNESLGVFFKKSFTQPEDQFKRRALLNAQLMPLCAADLSALQVIYFWFM